MSPTMKKKLKLNGEPHCLVILKVLDRDPHGRPNRVQVVYDDTKIPVHEGLQLHTAWVHESATEKTGITPDVN
jgi:hypothetical protein